MMILSDVWDVGVRDGSAAASVFAEFEAPQPSKNAEPSSSVQYTVASKIRLNCCVQTCKHDEHDAINQRGNIQARTRDPTSRAKGSQ